MQDFIKIGYLAKAFAGGDVTMTTDAIGSTPEENRINISVLVGDKRYTHSFQRTVLVNAMSDEDLQSFVIGVFKTQLDA